MQRGCCMNPDSLAVNSRQPQILHAGKIHVQSWAWQQIKIRAENVMAERQQRQRLRALRNDRNLARFVVEGRATGKQLGTGSYGSVEEVTLIFEFVIVFIILHGFQVEVNGLICAGKKIHDVLIDAANAGVENVAGKYVQECQLMSDLRHPNITLFLGVCFLPNCQLPVLLMERLDGSLDDLLETVPNIPLALKRSVLEDVSRGLLYLHKHTPQIIHRDLTAKNVLLTSYFVAKITDLGNSRIVNLQPGQLARTLSRLPGTLVYMPPEALSASSRYGPSLDIFSFGHLALFTLIQV